MSTPIPDGVEAMPEVMEKYRAYGGAYRFWATGIAMLGSFATLLSATVINVAIPEIMGSLGMSADEAQWLAAAYLAAGTITMLMNTWFIRAFGIAVLHTRPAPLLAHALDRFCFFATFVSALGMLRIAAMRSRIGA